MDYALLPYDSIMHLLVFWYVEKLPKFSKSIEGYPIILATAVATIAASSLVHNIADLCNFDRLNLSGVKMARSC